MLLSVVIALLLLGFSYMFVVGGLAKYRTPLHFEQVLADYAILPASLNKLVAKVLPIIEIAVGLALLISPARELALIGAAALLLTYTGAMTINLIRGRRDIDCGCSGPGQEQLLSGWLLLRNGGLLSLLLMVSLVGATPNLGVGGWLLALTGTTLGILLYQALTQLQANHQHIQLINRGN